MKRRDTRWDRLQKTVPILCVDGVVINSREETLLTKRAIEPFKGFWHLPGGRVHYGETVEKAVVRVVRAETGLTTTVKETLGIYADPNRDPRGHFVTIAFLLEPKGGTVKGDFQSSDLSFFKKLPSKMGFDSRKISQDGLQLWRLLKS